MLNITVDSGTVIADLKGMSGKVMKAAVRSMNRAITSGRAAMVKAIAGDTGLKSGDVRDAIPLRHATIARAEAKFRATIGRIRLIDFKARQTKQGVTYLLGQGRSRVPNAFIATMKSGHKGVFKVLPGSKRHGPKPHRSQLPIVELYGPSLGHVFEKYRPMGLARTKEAFDTAFAHQLKRALDGQADSGG